VAARIGGRGNDDSEAMGTGKAAAVGAVRTRSTRGSDRETDTRGPRGFFIIPKLSKPSQL
jgi:hypothetical protein